MGLLAGQALLEAAEPVVAVGPDPGLGLLSVGDGGMGPLAALVAGMEHLAASGLRGPVLLVACDLPFVTNALLRFVSEQLGSALASVPVNRGRLQPLAACYAPSVLPAARNLISTGRVSMRDLLETIDFEPVPEGSWKAVAPPEALMDVDTPFELREANEIAGGRQPG